MQSISYSPLNGALFRCAAHRPKLAIVGPFPPQQNGIADYIAELWEYQAGDYDLSAVVSDDAPEPRVAGNPVPFLRAFEAESLLEQMDYILYHVGNNTDHHFLLPLLFKHPGIVVLHDYCLSYLLETATFPLGDKQTYCNWMQHDYGVIGTKLAEDFLHRGLRGKFMAYSLPINGPILASSTALIAHSRYVQFKTAAARPGLPVHFVPHHISPMVDNYSAVSRETARHRLGLDEAALIITAPGFIVRPKLIDRVLTAFARLKKDIPGAQLVLAGERKPWEYDVDEDIARLCPGGGVTVTGFLSEDEFFLHLAACDVVVNLRYPSGGESSGTLARAIGLGRACVVLDHGPMGEFPDAIVRKIAFGPNLERSLEATLRTLLTRPLLRQELGATARAYALANYTAARSAQRYKSAIESALPRRRAAPPPPLTLFSRRLAATCGSAEGGDLIEAENGYWWRCGAAPFSDVNAPARQLLAVDGSRSASEILARAFGWQGAAVVQMTLEDLLDGAGRGDV